MKKAVLISLIGIMIFSSFLVINSCSKKEYVIRIGAILPLTGTRANAGSDGKLGIELALSEIKKSDPNFFKKVSVLYEDNQSKSQTTISVFNKLVNVDNCKIILGPLASSTSLSLVDLVNKNNILLYLPTSSSPKLSGVGQNIFRSGILSEQQAKKATDFASENLKAKTAAIFYMNDDTGEGYRRIFKENFIQLGGEILIQEPYSPEQTNYRNHILKIKAKNPDIVYIPATSRSLAAIVNQFAELAYHPILVSNFGIEGEDLIKIAKDNAEGILYTSINLDSKIVLKYKSFTSKDFNVISALCYDGMMSIYHAISNVKTDTISELANYLEKNEIKGSTGVFYFNDKHDAEREMIIKTVRDGNFIKFSQ